MAVLLNTGFMLPAVHTAWVNALLYLPLYAWIAPGHCQLAQPGDLSSYADVAAGARTWVHGLASTLGDTQAHAIGQSEELDSMRACVVLHVWLPAM
jgi:hypothetical protein